MLHWNIVVYGDENISEIPWKFWNMVLGREVKIRWTDGLKNEKVLCGAKEERNVLQAVKRRKVSRIGRILRRSVLKRVTEGKAEGTSRRWRTLKHLLGDLEEWEDIGIWRQKHYIALFEKLNLEEAVDLLRVRLRDYERWTATDQWT
jgi:hypothetical protein